MPSPQNMIGRVIRCSTRGFVGALRLPEPNLPIFGEFCLAQAQAGESEVVGLVYDISVEDDEFARQIAISDRATPEQIADHQQNRQVPVEFSALAVGYRDRDGFVQRLPPQPPLTLSPVFVMADEDIREFTRQLGFLPLILSTPGPPADELVAASLQRAADTMQESKRASFLAEAGRACSRLLSEDILRLENLLQALRPSSAPD